MSPTPTGAKASECENASSFVKLPGVVERALSAYRRAQWAYGKACAAGGDGDMPDAVAEWQALRRSIAAALASPAVVPESVRRAFDAYDTDPGNSAMYRHCQHVAYNWVRNLLATPSVQADTPPAGGAWDGWFREEEWKKVVAEYVQLAYAYHPVRPGFWDGERWITIGCITEGGESPTHVRPLAKPPGFAAAPAAPEPAAGGEDWRDDPSADERWSAGLDFAMEQLCSVLGVDPKAVRWDAATETLDGDVCSVIGNILTVWGGDDWRGAPSQAETAGGDGIERLREEVAYWRRDLAARLWSLTALYEAAKERRESERAADLACLLYPILASYDSAMAGEWLSRCDICGEFIRDGEPRLHGEDISGHARCVSDDGEGDVDPHGDAELTRRAEAARAALNAPWPRTPSPPPAPAGAEGGQG